jgi:hypothetical protein
MMTHYDMNLKRLKEWTSCDVEQSHHIKSPLADES